MTTDRRLLPAALVLLWAGTLHAQATAGRTAWTSPCTLDVVLVTFRDTTGQHRTDAYDYGSSDLPHGYTINADGALVPGTSSYTMDDFERLLSGGYDYSINEEEEPLKLIPEWTGTPTVADNNDGASETLPEVFGSLWHYFHVVSGGDFELHVRILNPERGGYPVWVQLPETKGHYAHRFRNMFVFWNHAYMAMRDSVRVWGLDSTVYDPPHTGYSRARRLRHKVLYLYSGAEFHEPGDNPRSLIHPRADQGTFAPGVIGYRYVAGERQGSGGRHRDADRFGAIGIHAHEIGHLLGFVHPSRPINQRREGRWPGQNPYTGETVTCGGNASFRQGRLSGWGCMQDGDGGPVSEGRGLDPDRPAAQVDSTFKYVHRSCPNPFNPLYLRDLNWGSWETISASEENKVIRPGQYYFIEGADDSEYVLEFRPAEGFGRYSSWYRFEQAPGLLIWKR